MTEPVILNLLPIAKGGGLQNALSFLECLAADPERRATTTVVCRDQSAISDFCKRESLQFRAVRATGVNRLLAELSGPVGDNVADVCFTLFGAPMFSARGRFINICGCAYSNLFYSEFDFWNYLRGRAYQQKRLIDWIRQKSIQKADFWIFETEVLRERAIKRCNFPPNRVAVVKMAPSGLVSKSRVDSSKVAGFKRSIGTGFRMLMLAGPHPNKRQALLPDLICALRDSTGGDFSFVTTMNEQDAYAQRVIEEVKARGLERFFTNLGPVPADDCASLIEACDALLCLSRLESFSNNFVEAWAMQKPLVVTDADWARHACAEAAVFVDPTDIKHTAKTLEQLMSTPSVRQVVVNRGAANLSRYHDAASKYHDYWDVIARARQMGFCSRAERRRIRWQP
jgi:glycosyltransferase involved in cell wall biosynthesis